MILLNKTVLSGYGLKGGIALMFYQVLLPLVMSCDTAQPLRLSLSITRPCPQVISSIPSVVIGSVHFIA